MNVLPSLDTYDLNSLPLHVLAEDISIHLDLDLNDTNLLALCTEDNLVEQRIKLSVVKTQGKGNIVWSTGTLSFDAVDVFTYSMCSKELHKFILNEKVYIEMLNHLGSYYKPDELLFAVEGEEPFYHQGNMYS